MHAQCIVCGDTIGWYLHGDKIFLEDDSWKQAYGELWVNASEIEKKYFMKDESHWDTLYRLIVYDTATNTHRLTGIGHTPLWIGDQFIKQDYYRAPKDESLAVLGVPSKSCKTDQNPNLVAVYYESLHWWFYTAEPKRDWKGLAFSIHMRCWNLAQCILGPMVERHLDMFTALALRKVREWKPGYEEASEDIYGSTEPFKIVAFKDLVQKSQKEGAKADMPQEDETPTPPFSRLSYLPREIRYLILDNLDYTDIPILKTAVHYHIQESYWRGRMAFYLIGLEDELLQEDKEDKQINWEYLCLETEKLDATTDTFKTRHRAVRILTEIKEKLLMVLREGHRLSLPEVIDDVQDEMVHEYWDLYGDEVLNPKDRWGTSKEMLRSLVDAGFIESSFWKLQDNPPHY